MSAKREPTLTMKMKIENERVPSSHATFCSAQTDKVDASNNESYDNCHLQR
jgi:hypothetical protein